MQRSQKESRSAARFRSVLGGLVCSMLALLCLMQWRVAALSAAMAAAALAPDGSCMCEPPPGVPWATPEGSGFLSETRFSPNVAFAMHHMIAALPSSWVFILVLPPETRTQMHLALNASVCAGKVQLWELGQTPNSHALTRVCPARAATAEGAWAVLRRVGAPPPRLPWQLLGIAEAVEAFVTGPRALWERGWSFANEIHLRLETYAIIPTNTYLVFQADGLLCAPVSEARLREFSAYDYVGAPWMSDPAPNAPWRSPGEATNASVAPDVPVGGNGGISLRNKRILEDIVRRHKWTGENEDVWLSYRVPSVGGRLPPRALAMQFSVETVFYPTPIAFHKSWYFLPAEQLHILMKNCPVLAERRQFF